MRTTVDLPTDLLRAARARAAERGESLEELLTRAVGHEVGATAVNQQRTRVVLPLIGGDAGPRRVVTNADIEAVLAAEDAERHAAP